MKNYRLLREIVRNILTEAKCPSCGDEDAYIGLNDVECPNPKCQNFSEKQALLTKKDEPASAAARKRRSNAPKLDPATGDWVDKTVEFDIDHRRVRRDFPDAWDDWTSHDPRKNYDDDSFSLDSAGRLWVEPGVAQDAWWWDDLTGQWHQDGSESSHYED